MARVAFLAVTSALASAAQPVPSAAQWAESRNGVTMFMHFGPCTFTGCQWDTELAPPSVFNPVNLDTDQWMQAAKLLGADEVCLTVRHVDGFTLWPSATTNYSVASSTWRNGTGDVVADFVASARNAGIRPCFYIILGFNIYANKTGVPGGVYLDQQVTALTELLTNYGPISRLWWDNYALNGATYQPVTHEGFVCPNDVLSPACPAWYVLIDTVRALSPQTLMIPGPDGCLVNAESYGGTYPLYFASTQGSYWCTSATAPSNNSQYVVAEADFSVLNPGDNWFWNPNAPVLDAETLWSQMTVKHSQGANIIMNVPPDTNGTVADNIMAMLTTYAMVYNGTYGTPVASLAAPVTGPCPGLSFTVAVPPTATFDQTLTQEDMSVSGQVVNGYTIEAQDTTGAWRLLPIDHGVTVGPRVVDWGLGNTTGVTALRWNCTESIPGADMNATISYFGAFLGVQIPSTGV